MASLSEPSESKVDHIETRATLRQYIQVRGIVQGVGFRPFVYHLAQTIHLTGYVLNTSEGVLIEIEGSKGGLARFLYHLTSAPPPLARIDEVNVTAVAPVGDTRFVIRDSVKDPSKFVLVSPDVSTCEDCWREFTDPHDRRYGYPFTNCTHCGPRYTIIRDIPYDRPLTTMAAFRMCTACQVEYDDPTNRRFHVQPNACPQCGPTLALVRNHALPPKEALKFNSEHSPLAIIREVHRLLHEGNIVAL